MAQRSRSTAAGPMGFILGLGIVSMLGSIVCEAVLSVRGLSVAVLVGCYGGGLRVVLGAAPCEGMGATECCSASIGKENTPGRCFYRECCAFALWCVGAVLCGQRLADHTLGIFEE